MKTTSDGLKRVLAFEALWTRYVAALENLDVARAREVSQKSCGALRSRCIRGAKKQAARIQTRLETKYDMDLGGTL